MEAHMPPKSSPIRVVQCPKCGSPVEGVAAGDIASCSYCSATLQVSAGASGHPVARLVNTETRAAWLGRSETLDRLQEELAQKDGELALILAPRQAKLQEALAQNSEAMQYSVLGSLVCLAGLVLSVLGQWVIGLVLAGVGWLLLTGSKGLHARARALGHEADTIFQESSAARAERDRLAQRIAELEAGLDDLADQL
jgi:hypothetical protein